MVAERATPFAESPLVRYLLAEREEILRHKWHLSERAGCDIGFDHALIDWVRHHRKAWRASHRPPLLKSASPEAVLPEPREGRGSR